MSDHADGTPHTAVAADVAGLVGRALHPGDVLSNGWVIHRVERLERGSRFAVTTSPAPLRVVVELPRVGNQYIAQTDSVGIWVDSVADRATHPVHQVVAQAIAEPIRVLEQGGVPGLPTASRPLVSTKPILYLTPGHLGDPDDLSLRALQVLAVVPVIFVESGKTEEVRSLLTRFGLRPTEGVGAPEIVELDEDDKTRRTAAVERWRKAVVAGLDTCLFGSSEGIPGFWDPGKTLVKAAAEMRDAVQIRTVGGSSALGHALMRVPSRLKTFQFCGFLDSKAEARRLKATLVRLRLPLVLFSNGAAVREFLPGVIRKSGLQRGTIHLLTAFTSDEEEVHAITATNFVLPSAQVLPDQQPIVIVIESDWMTMEMPGALVERFIAWLRGALTKRPRA